VKFGVYEVDPHAGELRRNGVKIKLQEQPFQVLAMLLERPGEGDFPGRAAAEAVAGRHFCGF